MKSDELSEIVISNYGISARKKEERLILTRNGQVILEIPFSKIKNISINSKGVSLSSNLIYECSKNNILISFHDYKGLPYSTLRSPIYDSANLSFLQIKICQTHDAFEFIKKITSAKAKNQVNLLKFYLRSRNPKNFNNHENQVNQDFVQIASKNIVKIDAKIKQILQFEFNKSGESDKSNEYFENCRNSSFGIEGRISTLYWDCMKTLVDRELKFTKRHRFKATDIVNCMLNYGYGILYNRVWQAVVKAGLNPHISYMHAFQANKPTLIFDLIEEFRQPFVDKPIFGILTKGKMGADLQQDEHGLLTKETRDQVIQAVISRLSSIITYNNKHVQCEDLIKLQVKHFIEFIKHKKPYKPFILSY